MIGYIYIIKNDVNNKVYIGQTVQGIKERFNQHIYMAKTDKFRTKLYKAMQDIGLEHFFFDELACIEVVGSNLSDLEHKFIIEYDSISTGYNSILPINNGITYHTLFDYYGDSIIDAYISGETYNDIADRFGISRNSVAKIVSAFSDMADMIKPAYRSEPYKIVMYSDRFEPIGTFESIKSAIKWINTNTKFKPDLRNGYNYIKGATMRGNIAYGHRWQLFNDLVYDGKVFRTKFDKMNFIKGKPFIEKFGYIICGDIIPLLGIGGYGQIRSINIEIVPDNSIDGIDKLSEAQLRRKELRENPIILKELLKKYNYSELGRMYECSPNYIKKIALSHGYSIHTVRFS